MSTSTGARRGISEESRTSDALKNNEQDLIQRMKPFNIDAPSLGPSSSGEEISNKPGDDGGFFEEGIAQIQGFFALVQKELTYDNVDKKITVVKDQLDDTATSFTTFTGAIIDDILDIIDGGDYNGQILKIRIPDALTSFTIANRNKDGNDTGNIFFAGVDNLITAGGEVLEFIYDTLTPEPVMAFAAQGAASGVWRLSSGTNAGGGNLVGTIEEALWTDGETTQFDFFVWHSNSNDAGEAAASVNMLENILYYVPFFVGKTVNVFRMGLKVQVASSTYTLAAGVYSNRTDGQNYPDTLLLNANQLHSGAGFKTILFGSGSLTPGLYWLAFNYTSGPPSIDIDGYDRGNCISIGWQEDGNDLNPMTGYFEGHASPTFPPIAADNLGIIFALTPLDTNAHYIRFVP